LNGGMENIEAFIGLGANLGDPAKMLAEAISDLNQQDGISVVQCSSLYRTTPVGKTDQPDFINVVVRIETSLPPEKLMTSILDTEHRHGRTRQDRWGPRTIDIDLLIYGNTLIVSDSLTIPHPRMHERRFVLVPLIEIAPSLKIPGTGKSLQEFLNETENQGNIEVLDLVLGF
jgi:2-amino-4-hydroxy-6-hydroxymethyldihydropteridine diphosphokinase